MSQVTVLMPSSRFLLPRDSLSKIVTGQMNWNTMEQHSRRQLLRYSHTTFKYNYLLRDRLMIRYDCEA